MDDKLVEAIEKIKEAHLEAAGTIGDGYWRAISILDEARLAIDDAQAVFSVIATRADCEEASGLLGEY